jgi:hypothetical protein
MDPTDLNVRLLHHAEHVAHADRFSHLYPPPRRTQRGPRHLIAALLLQLSLRLAPEQVRRIVASDTLAVDGH